MKRRIKLPSGQVVGGKAPTPESRTLQTLELLKPFTIPSRHIGDIRIVSNAGGMATWLAATGESFSYGSDVTLFLRVSLWISSDNEREYIMLMHTLTPGSFVVFDADLPNFHYRFIINRVDDDIDLRNDKYVINLDLSVVS